MGGGVICLVQCNIGRSGVGRRTKSFVGDEIYWFWCMILIDLNVLPKGRDIHTQSGRHQLQPFMLALLSWRGFRFWNDGRLQPITWGCRDPGFCLVCSKPLYVTELCQLLKLSNISLNLNVITFWAYFTIYRDIKVVYSVKKTLWLWCYGKLNIQVMSCEIQQIMHIVKLIVKLCFVNTLIKEKFAALKDIFIFWQIMHYTQLIPSVLYEFINLWLLVYFPQHQDKFELWDKSRTQRFKIILKSGRSTMPVRWSYNWLAQWNTQIIMVIDYVGIVLVVVL